MRQTNLRQCCLSVCFDLLSSHWSIGRTTNERTADVEPYTKYASEHCDPDQVGDINSFSFSAVKCFPKVIDRLAFEEVNIHNSKANIIMNSKSELHQPDRKQDHLEDK